MRRLLRCSGRLGLAALWLALVAGEISAQPTPQAAPAPGQLLFDADPLPPAAPRRRDEPAPSLAGCWRYPAEGAVKGASAAICIESSGAGWQATLQDDGQACSGEVTASYPAPASAALILKASSCNKGESPALDGRLECAAQGIDAMTCRLLDRPGAQPVSLGRIGRAAPPQIGKLPTPPARHDSLAPGCWRLVNLAALPGAPRDGSATLCFDDAGRGLASVWHEGGKACVGGVERTNVTPDGSAVRFSLAIAPGLCNRGAAERREQFACRSLEGAAFDCASGERDPRARFEPVKPDSVPVPTRLPDTTPPSVASVFEALGLPDEAAVAPGAVGTLFDRARRLAAQPAGPQRMRELPPLLMQLGRRAETAEQRDFVRSEAERVREEASAEAERLLASGSTDGSRAALQTLLRAIVLLGLDQRGSSALSELGRIYSEIGKAGDIETARLLWEIAGASGSPAALRNLGAVHERGLGVPADRAVALQFYRRAKAAGHDRVDADIDRVSRP